MALAFKGLKVWPLFVAPPSGKSIKGHNRVPKCINPQLLTTIVWDVMLAFKTMTFNYSIAPSLNQSVALHCDAVWIYILPPALMGSICTSAFVCVLYTQSMCLASFPLTHAPVQRWFLLLLLPCSFLASTCSSFSSQWWRAVAEVQLYRTEQAEEAWGPRKLTFFSARGGTSADPGTASSGMEKFTDFNILVCIYCMWKLFFCVLFSLSSVWYKETRSLC